MDSLVGHGRAKNIMKKSPKPPKMTYELRVHSAQTAIDHIAKETPFSCT